MISMISGFSWDYSGVFQWEIQTYWALNGFENYMATRYHEMGIPDVHPRQEATADRDFPHVTSSRDIWRCHVVPWPGRRAAFCKGAHCRHAIENSRRLQRWEVLNATRADDEIWNLKNGYRNSLANMLITTIRHTTSTAQVANVETAWHVEVSVFHGYLQSSAHSKTSQYHAPSL